MVSIGFLIFNCRLNGKILGHSFIHVHPYAGGLEELGSRRATRPGKNDGGG